MGTGRFHTLDYLAPTSTFDFRREQPDHRALHANVVVVAHAHRDRVISRIEVDPFILAEPRVAKRWQAEKASERGN